MITEMTSGRAADNTIIVVFADTRYREVIDCWLAATAKLHIENFIVIALDTELYAALSQRGVPCWLHEPCPDLASLWRARVKVVAELVDSGLNVIHSDADAIWIADPRAYLTELNADLVFSQGTIWPEQAHTHWGFVLCCGFFQLKSNINTRKLVQEWLVKVEQDNDDQVAINRLLLEQDVSWQTKSPYHRYYGNHAVLCSGLPITGTLADRNITISIVPHDLLPRMVMASDRPYVIHPLADKHPEAVRHALRRSLRLIGHASP